MGELRQEARELMEGEVYLPPVEKKREVNLQQCRQCSGMVSWLHRGKGVGRGEGLTAFPAWHARPWPAHPLIFSTLPPPASATPPPCEKEYYI